MTDNDTPEISEKTAWPAAPIDTYSSIKSGGWGYLIYYKGIVIPEFSDAEKPTHQEIIDRWGTEIKKRLPLAKLAFSQHTQKRQIQICSINDGKAYCIGALCLLDNSDIVVQESIESWSSAEDAEIAMLLGEWTQRDTTT